MTGGTSDRLILTPDQRVRVFVSSTLTELAAEREAVRAAVDRLHLLTVMFEAGARPHAPRDVYRSYLAQSQIFVGIYDESYGWIGPDSTISGLADEYRLARGLPRLVYVKEPAPDRDPRLVDLLAEVAADLDVVRRRFRSPDELRGLVERDLAALLSQRFHQTRQARAGEPGEVLRVPSARTPLVGREHELEVLTSRLTQDRVSLLTLVGPGGVGKTRLATALAERVACGYPDGVRFVDLSTAAGVDGVGEVFARALRLRTSDNVGSFDDVESFLRAKRMLLVVDNFEHVAGAAPGLAALLRAAPGVTALVTSRAPLRLTDERVYRVPPLRSAPQSTRTDLATITQRFSAVRLFVDRARAADRRFRLTDDNVEPVLEITRRLGGVPLAIELAAARVPLLPPAQIAALLDDQLSLLTGGQRDLPARQRTVRDTLAWSYRLLPPDARRLFARTGVFTGGFDLAAVEAVCAGESFDVFTALESLVDAALVEPDENDRFRMVDSVRLYALERLAADDDATAVRDRHAAHFVDFALLAAPHLNTPDSPVWLDRLDRDLPNLGAATDWLLESGRPGEALRIGWAIWPLWWQRGYIDESRRYISGILDQAARLSPKLHGRALVASGAMALVSGQDEQARGDFERARVLAREADDPVTEARALGPLGSFASRDGDHERAGQLLREAYELAINGDQQWLISLFHSRIGMIAYREGDPAAARRHLDDAVRVSAQGGDELGMVVARYTAAVVRSADGDGAGAHHSLLAGLRLAARSGDQASVGLFLAAFADLAGADGRLDRAVRLAAAAASFETPSSKLWMRAYVPPWPVAGPGLATIRVRLGDDVFDRGWREGERLGLRGAIDEAARE
ncbi:Predicted ATPase [Asanoa hainanensis]|uniref:Predicted ATPase n=1 Tax=Asanoa hainanensis TaxID=560556 RepID=A0A239NIF8_9ACTN|nr:Predicted ATPase [Asanoa hainanensis]